MESLEHYSTLVKKHYVIGEVKGLSKSHWQISMIFLTGTAFILLHH